MTVSSVPAASRASTGRLAIASSVGTTLEWYDFTVYNTLAALIFNRLFFPSFDPMSGTILAFSTYAVGYVSRPLGGVVFGHLGDKPGRRFVLVLTLVLMGLCSGLMGLLPTYASIGIYSPILLVTLRFLQGVALGGEWAGAVLISVEHGDQAKRGRNASFTQVGPSFGTILATGGIALITFVVGPDDFLAWAWRIPFLASIVLVGFGLWIRRGVEETPMFKQLDQSGAKAKTPIGDVLRRYWPRLLTVGVGSMTTNRHTSGEGAGADRRTRTGGQVRRLRGVIHAPGDHGLEEELARSAVRSRASARHSEVWFARITSPALVDPVLDPGTGRLMLTALVVVLRSLALCCRGHRAVALENLALRQQLAVFKRTMKRPPLRPHDRLFWMLLVKVWRQWRTALVVVHPDTVVRWHRQWLRRRWTRCSLRAAPGRPRTNAMVRALVMKIAGENPLWGAPRIHGELGKLGVPVSERTVSRLVRRPRQPPSQTWRTFLTNHVAALASIDFFTVPTVTGRLLFVFVVLLHDRRRIVHFNVTEHPTAAWTAQQLDVLALVVAQRPGTANLQSNTIYGARSINPGIEDWYARHDDILRIAGHERHILMERRGRQ